MAHDPEGLATFEAAGKKFTAVFGQRAIKATELYYDLPFFLAIQKVMPQLSPEDAGDKAKIAEASANIRITDIGNLFQFALLKHHRDLTEESVEDIIDDMGLAKVSGIIGDALGAALGAEDDDGSSENPPASRKKSTG